jgi:hypothetical protein
VALQRKGVKAGRFADAIESIESIRKCREIAKEWLREGARGFQTLYMTGTMQINRPNARDSEPVRRFAPGSY